MEVGTIVVSSSSSHDSSAEEEFLETSGCKHQWIIDTPAGPPSKGVCRLCGQERQFQNYIEGSFWGSDFSYDQFSGNAHIPTRKRVRDKINQEE